jgi:hypothetical protein
MDVIFTCGDLEFGCVEAGKTINQTKEMHDAKTKDAIGTKGHADENCYSMP